MKKFETKLSAKKFSLIYISLAIFEQQDPIVERCTKVANQINDAIQCYCIVYDEKKRKTVQLSLDRFFRPIPSTSKKAALQPSASSFTKEQEEEEEKKEESPQHVNEDDDDDADDPLPML